MFQAQSSQDESSKKAGAISRSSRTLLQDQPRKANVPRLVKDLHYDVLKDLSNLLNPETSIATDWRKFARELGFSNSDILVLEEQSNPAFAVFQKWHLEKHEFTGTYSSSFKVAIFC